MPTCTHAYQIGVVTLQQVALDKMVERLLQRAMIDYVDGQRGKDVFTLEAVVTAALNDFLVGKDTADGIGHNRRLPDCFEAFVQLIEKVDKEFVGVLLVAHIYRLAPVTVGTENTLRRIVLRAPKLKVGKGALDLEEQVFFQVIAFGLSA